MFRQGFEAVADCCSSAVRFFESSLDETTPSAKVLFVSNWRSKIEGVKGGRDLDTDRIFEETKDKDALREGLGWNYARDGLLKPTGSVFVLTAKCTESVWLQLDGVFRSTLSNVFKDAAKESKEKLDLSWAVDAQGLDNGSDLVALMQRFESDLVTELDLSSNFLCWPEERAVFDSIPKCFPSLKMLRLCRNTIDKPDFASWLNAFLAGRKCKVDLRGVTVCLGKTSKASFLTKMVGEVSSLIIDY
jgi:hypothetical protein